MNEHEYFDIDQHRNVLAKSRFVSYTDLLSVIDDLPDYKQELEDNLTDDPEDPAEHWLAAYATAYGPGGPMGRYLAMVAGFYADHDGIYFDESRFTAVQALTTLISIEYDQMDNSAEEDDHLVWHNLYLGGDDSVDYCSGHLDIALDFIIAWCKRNMDTSGMTYFGYDEYRLIHPTKKEKS